MNSADLDRAHVWHPFTQMREWNDPAHAPVVIVEGDGAVLKAEDGREYLDGNKQPERVIFCCFSREHCAIYKKVLAFIG